MKYEVWITVRGEQCYAGADPDRTELTAPGTLEKTEGGWLLTYQETEATGLEGTCTALRIGPERTILRRSGSLSSEMVFETGKLHTSLYELPYGALTVDIRTESVRHRLSEQGGVLEIRYHMEVEQQLSSRNCLKIQIKRKK